MSDEKKCPHCNKTLRSNNERGVCKQCFDKGLRGTAAEPGSPRAKPVASVRKQFKTITAALGFDADELLDGFRSSWLARIKASVSKAHLDDDDT